MLIGVYACTHLNGRSSTLQTPGLQISTMDHQGQTRIFGVYEPASLSSSANAVPLVLLLHGGGGGALQIFETEFGQDWRELADEHGFLLAAPQGRADLSDGSSHHWNDCRTGITNPDVATNLDDIGFVTSLIDLLSDHYSIDNTRVYATGASNGGMMSYRLAMEAPERFAAIGALIANVPEPSECAQPTAPISVLIMNGTEDPLIPYDGGCVANNACRRGEVASTDESVRLWVDLNETSTTPVVVNLPDEVANDGSVVVKSRYEHGLNNTEVWLYRVEGGGHTVPGEEPIGLARRLIVGNKNRDINGAVETWEFFQRHRR